MTPKSREAVPGYKEMDDVVSGLVGQINGTYGEAAWTPIRYINRSYSRKTLAGIYRIADVALVTPLRDGMNLVAKEYVAAQDAGGSGRADPVTLRGRRRGTRRRDTGQSA